MRYIPTTEQDRKDMLKSIGLQSMEGLFDDVPDRVRLQGELNLPSAQTEYELFKSLKSLAEKNNNIEQYPSFSSTTAFDAQFSPYEHGGEPCLHVRASNFRL